MTIVHRYSWECKIQKQIQIKIKNNAENENKTKTCPRQTTYDRVCLCAHNIPYKVYTCVSVRPKMLVSQFSTDEKLTISLLFPYHTQARVLRRPVERKINLQSIRLRQGETSSENTQKWPEMQTKILQTVDRAIYHTRTIISQPHNEYRKQRVKLNQIYFNIQFDLSLSL